jgi:hypothetical protein
VIDFIVQQWWLLTIMVLSMAPLVRRFVRSGVLATLQTLDRRWIFLFLLWAVLVPIYYIGVTGKTFPCCWRSTTTRRVKASSVPWPPPSSSTPLTRSCGCTSLRCGRSARR